MKDRIRKIRRDLDLTQQEFADRIGIKRNTIANYETGRNEPIDSVVSLICREFGVNEEWLRDGTGEMFAPDASDELEALVKRYDLSNADQVLIEKYINLKAGSRETIIDFITDVVAALETGIRMRRLFLRVLLRSWISMRKWRHTGSSLSFRKKRRQDHLSRMVETEEQIKRRRSRGIF